jgi:uncharacterized protein
MAAFRIADSIDPQLLLRCLSNESLHLVLLPTEACNFRCVYCYEDFRLGGMQPEVVHGVKALLSRRAPGLADLTISWFGGEPLLARRVIEDVMTHVRALAEANPRLRVTSDATTNGYLLTRDLAERLLDLGVSQYQVSFDGTRGRHDLKRVRAGGGATFDRIWGNLLDLRGLERDFKISIRVHVDRENVEDIRQFIDQCAEAFARDPRYEMFIRGLSRLGGPNDPNLVVLDRAEGERIYEELKARARSRGLRTLEIRPYDSVCYAARGNSYVVRADGRLNKCTVALEHPSNQVGRIRENGTVEVDAEKMLSWMRGLQSGDTVELKCPMKGYAVPSETPAGIPVRGAPAATFSQ